MSKSKRIFLVDDDVLSLKRGRDILQERYTVTPVTSGNTLLEMVDKFHADIILLDIEMPGMDGYEVLKQLKENPKTSGIPVLLLASKDDIDREKGFLLGAVDYMRKPFSEHLLIKRIERVLLLEQQKVELQNFSDNFNLIKSEHKKAVEDMERAMLLWAADLIEFSSGTDGKDRGRLQFCLNVLLAEMLKVDVYADEIRGWEAGIDTIAQSAALHDIGIVKVPNNILQKLVKLEPDEYEQIKKHTDYGKSLIEKLKIRLHIHKYLDLVQTMAFLHHERWDGTGYPLGMKGENIPLLARVVAIVDVYMALTSNRVYKKARSHEEALQIIEDGRGTQFDPELVSLFLSVAHKLV